MKNKKSIHAGSTGLYDTVVGILAFPATVIFSTFTFISFIVDYWPDSRCSGMEKTISGAVLGRV